MPAATWIAHVKSVYSKGGMSYKEAMKRAAKTWKSKKKGAATAAPARKSRGKRKSKAKEDEKEPEEKEPKRKRKRASQHKLSRSIDGRRAPSIPRCWSWSSGRPP